MAYVFDASINSVFNYDNQYDLTIDPVTRMAFGAGYSYKRLGVEFRYYANQKIISEVNWLSEYRKASLLLTYQLF